MDLHCRDKELWCFLKPLENHRRALGKRATYCSYISNLESCPHWQGWGRSSGNKDSLGAYCPRVGEMWTFKSMWAEAMGMEGGCGIGRSWWLAESRVEGVKESRVPPRSFWVALDAEEHGAICQWVQSALGPKWIIRAMPELLFASLQ